MTISDELKIVRDLLVSVCGNDIVFHYHRPPNMKRYVVWAEEGEETSFGANNRKEELKLTGSIDVYTPIEFDPLIDALEIAFSQSERVSAVITAAAYDTDVDLIHYTWQFWVA